MTPHLFKFFLKKIRKLVRVQETSRFYTSSITQSVQCQQQNCGYKNKTSESNSKITPSVFKIIKENLF